MTGFLNHLNVPRFSAPALCREVDPGDLFFPEKGASAQEPKAICRECDVSAECLQFALDNNEPAGIWGGLTPRERQRLRRRPPVPKGPQPIKHGTAGGATTHYSRGEKPCDACREAYNRDNRERAARRRRAAA